MVRRMCLEQAARHCEDFTNVSNPRHRVTWDQGDLQDIVPCSGIPVTARPCAQMGVGRMRISGSPLDHRA